MSINTYDEQKFWEEMDILFPDIVKAITSLAKKSYTGLPKRKTMGRTTSSRLQNWKETV